MLGNRFIGRYKVEEELGRGGMGIVYRCEDPRLERTVAIKVLPERKTSGKALDRFKREARVCARLDHPYILKIYDWGEDEGSYHIVMEYVEGVTLREIIGDDPRVEDIDVAEMTRIFVQTCQALEYAHALGITHRDIKPENIMVTSTNGRWDPTSSKVKVMDFGLAVLEGHHSLTDHGAVMGTIAYFAPEQAKGEPADHRSDIYSLGAVFYEMLTGELPFDASNPSEMIRRHLETPAPSPRIVNPRVAGSLECIVLRCMRKDPNERYASVRDIRGDLERYRTEADIPAPHFWGTGYMPEPAPRPAPQPEPALPPVRSELMTQTDANPDPITRLRAAQAEDSRRLQQLWAQGRPLTPMGNLAPMMQKPPSPNPMAQERRNPPAPFHVPPLASPHTPGMPPDIAARLGPPLPPKSPSPSPLPPKTPSPTPPALDRRVSDRAPSDVSPPARRASDFRMDAAVPPPPVVPPADPSGGPLPLTPSGGRGLPPLAQDLTFNDAAPPIASKQWIEEAAATDRRLDRYEEYMARLRHDPVTIGVPPILCACGTENAGDRKYCIECGSLLAPSQFLQDREVRSQVELGLHHLRQDNLLEAQQAFSQAVERDPNNAAAHKHLGQVLLRLNDSIRAEEELRLALSLNAADADTLVNLAALARQNGRKSEATTYLSQAVKIRPSDAGLRCQLAFMHANRGQMSKAIDEYRAALAYDPRNLEAHLQLAIIYGAQNFIKEAITEFEHVVHLDPENLTAWQWLGKLYSNVSRLNEAEKALLAAVNIAPNDANAHADLGALYEAQRREDLAVRELRAAIALEQGHTEARQRLAQVYLRHHKPEEAIAQLEELAIYRPTDPAVHQQLGELYLDRGDTDRALQHFERSVTLNPTNAEMHNKLGQLYFKKDYNSLTVQEYQKAVTLDPYNPSYREDLGMAYYAGGNREGAIVELKKACILDARNVDYFKALGMLHLDEGRFDEAIGFLKRALELAPRDAQAHGLLGRVYVQQKLLNWAVLEFQKAQDLEPNNRLFHIYLARSYAELNRPDQAVHEFRKAISLMDKQSSETPENRRALGRSYQDLARAYLDSGNIQAAREMADSALTLAPHDTRGLHLMGMVLSAQKQWPKALEFLTDALKREPQNPEILADVGAAYAQTGDHNKAMKALRTALNLAPRRPALYERVAEVMAMQGKYDEARELVSKAMSLENRRADHYHGMLGKLYFSQGQFQKAAGAYQQARVINAWDPSYCLGLARAFERLGRPADAVNELRQGLAAMQLSDAQSRELQQELDRIIAL